jgi:hypothetical protein
MNKERLSTIPPAETGQTTTRRKNPVSDPNKIHTDAGCVSQSKYYEVHGNTQKHVDRITKNLEPGEPFGNRAKVIRKLTKECLRANINAPTPEMIENLEKQVKQAMVRTFGRPIGFRNEE